MKQADGKRQTADVRREIASAVLCFAYVGSASVKRSIGFCTARQLRASVGDAPPGRLYRGV